MVGSIYNDKVNLSLLIGVNNENVEEHIQFLYEIVYALQLEGKLNDSFTKLELRKKVSSRLSFIDSDDIGDSLEWMVKNTPYIYLTDDRSAGANHYKLKSHPWE